MKMLAGLSVLFGVPALVAAFAVWRGYILSILWGWFLVPLGVSPITIPLAIGFSLIVGYFTNAMSKRKDENDVLDTALELTIAPLLFLAIGWIVHFWV